MASTYTTNLHLEKPDGDDDINVSAINANSDTLDSVIKALQDLHNITIAYPTNLNSNVWTSGTISLRRRSGIVQIKIDGATFAAVSERTVIAIAPEGYRPATESYFRSADGGRTYLIRPNGEIAINAQSAGQVWGDGTFIVG